MYHDRAASSDRLGGATESDNKFILLFNYLLFILLLVVTINIRRRLYHPLGSALCQIRQEMKSGHRTRNFLRLSILAEMRKLVEQLSRPNGCIENTNLVLSISQGTPLLRSSWSLSPSHVSCARACSMLSTGLEEAGSSNRKLATMQTLPSTPLSVLSASLRVPLQTVWASG